MHTSTPNIPKPSDICVTIRFLDGNRPDVFSNLTLRSLPRALEILEQARPARLEWSYVSDRETIARFRDIAPVFVAALNTKDGHAKSFDGDPVIAPWMRYFGTPGNRFLYICQNNPDDLQAKIDIAAGFIRDGITHFHFDDWYCNAQMILFRNPCFCEHCMREFAAELGIPLNYRSYLRTRGIDSLDALLTRVANDDVPLWCDYRSFQRRTVTRFFRRLKAAMNQAHPDGVTLSVNGLVSSTREDVGSVLSSVDYFNGEVQDISIPNLLSIAEASKRCGKVQIVLICPHEKDGDDRTCPGWINRVRQAIAVSYCLGMIPLFPYDVYMGSDDTGRPKPRWFGTWEEYGAPYEVVREHPDWFDEFEYRDLAVGDDGTVTIVTDHRTRAGISLTHTIQPDGTWHG